MIPASAAANHSDKRERLQQRLARRYPTSRGHCIYCGAISRGLLCTAHSDLAANDPLLTASITALPRRTYKQPRPSQ
jgi:hypothetical protein